MASNFCELCERFVKRLTKHHLIPKTRHKNKRNKKNFDRQEVKDRVLWVCRECHNHIHQIFTNKELEYDYNTKEKLISHPEIAKFIAWISKTNWRTNKI